MFYNYFVSRGYFMIKQFRTIEGLNGIYKSFPYYSEVLNSTYAIATIMNILVLLISLFY